MPVKVRADGAVAKLGCCFLLALSLRFAAAQVTLPPDAVSWQPVTDEERQMKTPVVEKDAGVEAIFWRVHVLDELLSQDVQRVLYHYVRLKVFNEKGKEAASTIDIPYDEKSTVLAITGRTIRPDGSIVDLKKDAVFSRDLLRSGRLRLKVKSFAMPAVEPGAILEYRWKEIRVNSNMLYIRLNMQREYPVQRVTYYVRPLSKEYTSYRMGLWPFNCKPSPSKLERNGFTSTTLEKVPAFKGEPMMPGEPNVRPWVLAFYHEDEKRTPDKYWNDIGKKEYGELKASLKLTDELKSAAAEAVSGAKTDEEKVMALIRYLRKQMRELFDRKVTDAERTAILKQMPKDRYRTSAEVFKSRIGTAHELNTLFAAMASHAGLEARPALVADRDDLIFDPVVADRYFLRNIDMAVKIDGAWKLYDVSTRRLPPGMVGWREEGSKALLSDPKKPEFILSPVSPPDSSISLRKANMSLTVEGALEGDVEETYSGHAAAEHRSYLEDLEAARRAEELKKHVNAVFPQAEVSDIHVSGVENTEEPLQFKYRVKIPNYAQRTGKRLLFQPLFFGRGVAPLFEATEHRYDIFFPHAWHEIDSVSINFPPGFTLDNPENPGSLNFGKPGAYTLKIMTNQKSVICARELQFGNEGILYFPQKAYPQIKNLFDEIHRRDNLTLSAKQTESAGGGQ